MNFNKPSRREFVTTAAAAIAGSAQELAGQTSPAKNTSKMSTGDRHLPRIGVHADGHFLQTEEGRPFFWLGDTAWQLIHATTRDECSYYLRTRAGQGFTTIQAVVLAEFDGIRKPSALGLRPFENEDPSKPNERYFERVVEVVDEAASVGLYIALLPTWGDKLTAPWGAGPRIFRNDIWSKHATMHVISRRSCATGATSSGCSEAIGQRECEVRVSG